MDSGASNHMTGDLAFLHDVNEAIPILVILPNRTTTTSTKKGRVALSEKITLFDVLFVPNLACNLISIPQLTLELNCQILFTNHFCVVQNHISMMPIGMGKTSFGVGGLLLQINEVTYGFEDWKLRLLSNLAPDYGASSKSTFKFYS